MWSSRIKDIKKVSSTSINVTIKDIKFKTVDNQILETNALKNQTKVYYDNLLMTVAIKSSLWCLFVKGNIKTSPNMSAFEDHFWLGPQSPIW